MLRGKTLSRFCRPTKAASFGQPAAAPAAAAAAAVGSPSAAATPVADAATSAAFATHNAQAAPAPAADATVTNAELAESFQILQSLAMRGLRAAGAMMLGVGMLVFARNRKKRELAAQEEEQRQRLEDDPTQRYLKEMGSVGWDVEEGERAAAEVKTSRALQK
jgi:hypothetical protein